MRVRAPSRSLPRCPKRRVLVLDLVEWLLDGPRPYEQVMEVWKSTCPRLTIWEDAVEAGFVRLDPLASSTQVRVTRRGRRFLEANGRRAT